MQHTNIEPIFNRCYSVLKCTACIIINKKLTYTLRKLWFYPRIQNANTECFLNNVYSTLHLCIFPHVPCDGTFSACLCMFELVSICSMFHSSGLAVWWSLKHGNPGINSSVIPLWSTNGDSGGLLLQFAQDTLSHRQTCTHMLILPDHDPPYDMIPEHTRMRAIHTHKQTHCHS